MRSIYLVFIILCSMCKSMTGQETHFEKIELDVFKLGIVFPFNDINLSPSLYLGSEARYNLTNQISLGLGFSTINVNSDLADSGGTNVVNWSVSADYYYNTKSPYRFFTGLGYGIFSVGETRVTTGTFPAADPIPGISSTGFTLKIGSEVNHVRIEASYNHSFKAEVLNYLVLSATYTLGGGLRP